MEVHVLVPFSPPDPLVPLPRHEELDSFFFWAVKDIVPEFTKDRLCTYARITSTIRLAAVQFSVTTFISIGLRAATFFHSVNLSSTLC